MDAPAADVTSVVAALASAGWPAAPAERRAADVERDAAAILEAVELTVGQRAILEFERQWWRQAGAKEQAIRENFEMSPTRYYQALNALLDLPEALTYDPPLVHRLQRLRTSALRSRRLR